MAQAYSMEGFEIRIDGGVLEMRTEGTRKPEMGSDPGRSFESFLANSDISGVLFDVRGAQYEFSDLEWEERARTISRVCQSFPTAIVSRPDQDAATRRVLDLLELRGGTGLSCRSRQVARDWLQEMTAPSVPG
ncbi:hypothetical protein [Maricaulis maris]|uniref:hypothetical protein n=1 Tax=Maricaulis maris TaxID=74318 RepID=UPI002922C76E|nr:hypothetical protein MACH15_21530 [Maricaulis maris]